MAKAEEHMPFAIKNIEPVANTCLLRVMQWMASPPKWRRCRGIGRWSGSIRSSWGRVVGGGGGVSLLRELGWDWGIWPKAAIRGRSILNGEGRSLTRRRPSGHAIRDYLTPKKAPFETLVEGSEALTCLCGKCFDQIGC
jgi:hypothetical protein